MRYLHCVSNARQMKYFRVIPKYIIKTCSVIVEKNSNSFHLECYETFLKIQRSQRNVNISIHPSLNF